MHISIIAAFSTTVEEVPLGPMVLPIWLIIVGFVGLGVLMYLLMRK